MPKVNRRQFLEESMLATAAAVAATQSLAFADEPAKASANDTINAAIIGCGIRGKQHAEVLSKLPDCAITHVCDPDSKRAEEVAALLVKLGRPAPKAVQDLRKVFDDQSVDVAFVATPNHWHALAAIWAMQAGKDVYVEKPVSHNVAEGRRIVQAARKLNRICQGGTQNRSRGAWQGAVEYIQDGKLGRVELAKSIVYGRRGSVGGPGLCSIPETVDYDLWLGPAAKLPLTRRSFHYDWHWFWNTGNGELGNNNIHYTDLCRWCLGVTGMGNAVLSYGGRLGYTDSADTPNTQVVIHDFGDKTLVTETRGLKSDPYPFHNTAYGALIYGTEGIIVDGSLFEPDGTLVRTFEGKSQNHFANFLKAVRSRKVSDLNADILETHQSTALCHVGNISYRLGATASPEAISEQLGQLKVHDQVRETFERTRKHLADNQVDLKASPLTLGSLLRIVPEAEAFQDNPEADALLTRSYRPPFVVPSEQDL
ncbi:MAG: Gfo/Idh/MocA family oxidoreductase [Isosphaeraceae bacterium]